VTVLDGISMDELDGKLIRKRDRSVASLAGLEHALGELLIQWIGEVTTFDAILPYAPDGHDFGRNGLR
jgi:hypothetical protein